MKLNSAVGMNAVSGVSQKRSVFPRPVDLKTAGKASFVIPLWWDEVLPGDSVRCDIHGICRFIPNIHATMDNAYLDIYGFFVPNRLLWDHWEKFITLGNNPSAWTEDTGLNVPQINFKGLAVCGPIQDSLADYLGIPLSADNAGTGEEPKNDDPKPVASPLKVSCLPFRAYNKIINDWFVNLNVSSPIFETTDDEDRDYNNSEYNLYTAFKLPDVFTLALPSAQRGPSVLLPLGDEAPIMTSKGTNAPVSFDNELINVGVLYNDQGTGDKFYKMNYDVDSGGRRILFDAGVGAYNHTWQHLNPVTENYAHHAVNGDDVRGIFNGDIQADLSTAHGVANLDQVVGYMYADLKTASSTTINQLRLAFQTQAFFELNARCGNNRYIEYLKSVFGVSNGDARLQRAEYLFGCRNLVNCNEVTQVSSSTETSPIGEVAGKIANVINEKGCFNHSFGEHGVIMYVMVVRNANSYSQGVPRKFDKLTWLDFFNPIFDNIGEQPIKKKELFLSNNDTDDETFGFQEAWFNYRYGENISSSYFRADASGSLLSWTYGDLFESAPGLDEGFLKSDYTNIERTLALQGQNQQFICNFLFDNVWTRPMKVHSIPGRIDHI